VTWRYYSLPFTGVKCDVSPMGSLKTSKVCIRKRSLMTSAGIRTKPGCACWYSLNCCGQHEGLLCVLDRGCIGVQCSMCIKIGRQVSLRELETTNRELAAYSSQLSAYILQLTYMRLALFKGKQEESKMKYGTYMQHFGLQVSKRLLSLISKYFTNSGFTALLNQCICV